MLSNTREEIAAAFDALKTAVSEVVGLSFDVLTTPERLNLLERLEGEARRLPVSGDAVINQIAEQADATEAGARLPAARADRAAVGPTADRGRAGCAERGYRGRSRAGHPRLPASHALQRRCRNPGKAGSHPGRLAHHIPP